MRKLADLRIEILLTYYNYVKKFMKRAVGNMCIALQYCCLHRNCRKGWLYAPEVKWNSRIWAHTGYGNNSGSEPPGTKKQAGENKNRQDPGQPKSTKDGDTGCLGAEHFRRVSNCSFPEACNCELHLPDKGC